MPCLPFSLYIFVVSVRHVSSTKMSKREVTQTTPHNIPGILVLDAEDHVEIRLKVILIRTQNAGCVGENLRFSIYSRTPPFSTLFCVSFPVCVTGGDRHQVRSGSRGLFKFKWLIISRKRYSKERQRQIRNHYSLSNSSNSDNFQVGVFVQFCSSRHDFDWRGASRGPSAVAKLLVYK